MTTTETKQREILDSHKTGTVTPEQARKAVQQVKTDDKKWKWNRDLQEVRNKIVLNQLFVDCVDSFVKESGDAGASVTAALRDMLAAAKTLSNEGVEASAEEIETFIEMDRTNQRLVIRKILHNGYRNGKYDLVEAVSQYRTGKKSGTLNYVLKG